MKIIFDKDGTLFDNSHRAHLLPTAEAANKVEGWSAFNKACMEDEPIEEIMGLYHATAPYLETYIVTGAAEDSRYETELLLSKHGLQSHDKLIMRPISDHRKAADFKRDVFLELGLEAGDLVIDDDHHIVAMIRAEFPGVHVLQVATKCAAVLNNMSACEDIRGTKSGIPVRDDVEE